ncbi:hypothetical protein SBOR_3523 [Sclerotinia borealis F-4128]|uniref:Uncharacterized protein n=1 Tax=Sclerotinia borealis (strain F-4128) TaxID=1432307 RepID=W9CJJ9_SCLBF|nr:hypothetical protein SBOR_3523 [Sclerotinia borealis F-4128]
MLEMLRLVDKGSEDEVIWAGSLRYIGIWRYAMETWDNQIACFVSKPRRNFGIEEAHEEVIIWGVEGGGEGQRSNDKAKPRLPASTWSAVNIFMFLDLFNIPNAEQAYTNALKLSRPEAWSLVTGAQTGIKQLGELELKPPCRVTEDINLIIKATAEYGEEENEKRSVGLEMFWIKRRVISLSWAYLKDGFNSR